MIAQFMRTTAIAMLLVGSVHTQELLSNLPSCALSCITSYALQAGCNLSDVSCLCAHQLWAGIVTCAEANCTTRDALDSHRIAGQACDAPARDESAKLVVVSVVFASIAAIFMVLRVFVRSLKHWELWGWDDAFIVLCFVTGIPITVTDIVLAHYGFGQDIWELSSDQIDAALFWFFILEITYLSSTLFMKLSILAFYLRIFVDEHFRRRVFVVIGICVAFSLSFVASAMCQCTPVSYIWLRWDDQRHGTCLHVNSVIWAHAVINIVLDIGILTLPLPILTSLHFQYSWKSKAQIAAMFSVGLLVTLVSILRLRTLVVFAGTDNPTWNYMGAALWSTIEVHVGIVCTCLPAARAFVTRFVPEWLSQTDKASLARYRHEASQQPPSQKVSPSTLTSVAEGTTSQSGTGSTVHMTERRDSGDSEHAMYDCYRKEWI